MITTTITAAIVAILSFFGIPPGPYVVGLAIGVKILVVIGVALLGTRILKKRKQAEPPPPAPPTP